MKVYLDIDGVLVLGGNKLVRGAAEFIKFATENFDTYWLTTHCVDGDPMRAVDYIQRSTDENLTPWLSRVKPTVWADKKTEAIDFSTEFLWFDDNCFLAEKLDLKENDAYNSWIEINLKQTPDQMVRELDTLKAFAEA